MDKRFKKDIGSAQSKKNNEQLAAFNLKEGSYMVFNPGVNKAAIVYSLVFNGYDPRDFDIYPLINFPLLACGQIYFICV